MVFIDQMNYPDPNYERTALLNVIEQMKNAEDTERMQTLICRIIFGTGYTGLLMAFFIAINGVVHPFTSAFLAAFVGCAIGFATFLQFAHKQRPVTRGYIDLQCVQRRLDELEI